MSIRRIVTEQAPSAKPVGITVSATTDWQTVIDVPEYDVPVVGFGTQRRIAPGVAEISSPMLASNKDTETGKVSVRIIRGLKHIVQNQTQTDYAVFQGGIGHQVGDEITLENSTVIDVVAVDANGSVTEFSVQESGSSVFAETNITQVFSSGAGVDFSITVQIENLDVDAATFSLVNQVPVEPFDTFVIPFNGQFLSTGDQLQVLADQNDRVDIMISFTEGQAEEDDLPIIS